MSPLPSLNIADSPTPLFQVAYPPPLHIQVPPQSIRVGYPTIASYSPYLPNAPQPPPSPVFVPSFHYPPPISPVYPQPVSFSPPPATYPLLPIHPRASYPQLGPTPPGGVQDDDGGTWYYVPSQQQHHEDHGSNPTSTHVAPSTTGSSSSAASPVVSASSGSRLIQRRPYHPNPPGQRSEWVMWAGNVPSDAAHAELWRFFTAARDGGESSASSNSNEFEVSAGGNGVVSIFPISRSNCAFVNYDTEAHLQAAIERFNGVSLRPDPRCARLVCRVRHKGEDLRAGVGGQRGIGLHRGWVKAKEREQGNAVDHSAFPLSACASGASSSDAVHSLAQNVSELSRDAIRPPPHPLVGSSSSGSQASTNSSLLQGHFPQRFFILKSHKQDDLELSVRTGVWATQAHNEGVLDRAFGNSRNVFLIFSVNKSGEFYGYARMTGLVGEGTGERVTWAARNSASDSPIAVRTPGATAASAPFPTMAHHDPHAAVATERLLNDEHLVADSPAAVATPTSTPPTSTPPTSTPPRLLAVQSAPTVPGTRQRSLSPSPAFKHSLDQHLGRLPRVKDLEKAHQRTSNARLPSGPSEVAKEEHGEMDNVGEESDDGRAGTREEGWGKEFRLDWLCTEHLSFQRTRHLRNPWNHNREVKVSRDGTELEPSVGQSLLEEWLRETQKN
ncbi:YT521-B-like domain-containing protein [Mycena crocata]|nr:YT521-B-like domain-containing protein [Mycena crocata]